MIRLHARAFALASWVVLVVAGSACGSSEPVDPVDAGTTGGSGGDQNDGAAGTGGAGGATSGGSGGDAGTGGAGTGATGGAAGTGGSGATGGTGSGGAGKGGAAGTGGTGGVAIDARSEVDVASDAPREDAAGDATSDSVPDPTCSVVTMDQPTEGSAHVPICSPVVYGTNPPSSGSHYPEWAAYQTYAKTFPRGFWVHSLEHGAIVITYNCAEGCATEVAAAQALIDTLPVDAPCGAGQRRIIMLPDPDLDVRFAASAWGATLRAKCFDRAAFAAFIDLHTDHAPESICGGGVDPNGGDSGTPVCQ